MRADYAAKRRLSGIWVVLLRRRRSLTSAQGCALATLGGQVGFSMRNSEGVAQPIETSATPSESHESNVTYIPGLPERNPGLEISERFQR